MTARKSVEAGQRTPRRKRNPAGGAAAAVPAVLPSFEVEPLTGEAAAASTPVAGNALGEAPSPPDPVRPFVLVNMAITADGKIATANRAVRTFGSPADRGAMLELRSTVDAVMAGARTVDSDPVDLGPGPSFLREQRVRAGLAEYNLRVIVSGAGTINSKAFVFQKRFSPIVVLTTERISSLRRRELEKVADVVKICGCNEIDFNLALHWLHDQWKVRRLLVEGGGDLNAGLIRAGLVDELHLTLCPWIVGGRAAPTMADGLGVNRLAGAAQFELVSLKPAGRELYLIYRAVRPQGRSSNP